MMIFSSNVIWAPTWFARSSGDALEPTHGQLARGWLADTGGAAARDATTTATTSSRAARPRDPVQRKTVRCGGFRRRALIGLSFREVSSGRLSHVELGRSGASHRDSQLAPLSNERAENVALRRGHRNP